MRDSSKNAVRKLEPLAFDLSMEDVFAIFDIGKTNKKLILFDDRLNLIQTESNFFEEAVDEDGFPCENLKEVEAWINNSLHELSKSKNYRLVGINFSAYGASLVHLDYKYDLVTPLYNYLKPFSEEIMHDAWKRYGGRIKLELQTASPFMGMLNSGFQLLWLQQKRHEVYKRISLYT